MSDTPQKSATATSRGSAMRRNAEVQFRNFERKRRLSGARITKTDEELIAEAVAQGRVTLCSDEG